MSDDEWEENFSLLKGRVTAEIVADVESFFRQVERVSDEDNLAIRWLDSKQANKQARK